MKADGSFDSQDTIFSGFFFYCFLFIVVWVKKFWGFLFFPTGIFLWISIKQHLAHGSVSLFYRYILVIYFTIIYSVAQSKNLETSQLLAFPYPTYNPSANSVKSTIIMCPHSGHVSPSPQLQPNPRCPTVIASKLVFPFSLFFHISSS